MAAPCSAGVYGGKDIAERDCYEGGIVWAIIECLSGCGGGFFLFERLILGEEILREETVGKVVKVGGFW